MSVVSYVCNVLLSDVSSLIFLSCLVCVFLLLFVVITLIYYISGGDIPDGKNRHLLTLKHAHVTSYMT